MLSEEEIKGEIQKVHADWAYGRLSVGQDWPSVAAHAIAERLREGVVYEEILDTSFDGHFRLWRKEGTGRVYAGELVEPRLAGVAGTSSRVIVRREGDGQGVDSKAIP